jgi:hypothetical protein
MALKKPRRESNPRSPALQAGRSTRNATRPRALDWDRTSDFRTRIPVLYPLSYEGMVGAGGFEPSQHKATGLQPAPTLQRRRAPMG